MRRLSRTITTGLLSTGIVLLVPGFLLAQEAPRQPGVIGAEGGDTLVSSMGVRTRWTVGSVSTGSSQMVLVEAVFPPGHETASHLHETDEEIIYVLEGELRVTLGDQEYSAGPGATAFVPPGTWMALANPTDQRAVALVMIPRAEAEQCMRVLFSPDADDEARAEAVGDCGLRIP